MHLETQAPDLAARIEALCQSMCAHLVERDEPARFILLAALAGEHVLLLGPPGTAKSALARRLQDCFAEGIYFERLLTKFSVPEELFGPLSIKRLERDEYHRLTDGYLPSAAVAFLDEIFNANSAILNALLTILNERQFDNGASRVPVPLVSVVGASNQVPDAPELAALHDRFLFRFHVAPVSTEGFRRLLDMPEGGIPPAHAHRLTTGELAELRDRAAQVTIPPAVQTLLQSLRGRLEAKEIYVSDRRWRRIVQVLRTAAHTSGRGRVALADCALVVHCVWNRIEQIELANELFQTTLDAMIAEEAGRYRSMTDAFVEEIERERSRREHRSNPMGELLYYDDNGTIVTETHKRVLGRNEIGELLFRPPPDMMSPKRRGYTMNELWDLHFQNMPQGMYQLEEWARRPTSQLFESVAYEPVYDPMSFSDEHLARRREQLSDLRDDVRAFRRDIEALHGGAGPSIWIVESRFRAVVARMESAEGILGNVEQQLDHLIELVARLPRRAA